MYFTYINLSLSIIHMFFLFIGIGYINWFFIIYLQLFVTGGKKSQPITGLEFDRMPTENSNATEYKYYILVTTPR